MKSDNPLPVIKKETFVKFPFYAKVSLILIGLYVFIGMLSITKDIIIPLIYSTIIAILISPIVKFFVRIGINRVVAISVTLILTLIIIVSFGYFLFTQASMFIQSWPALVNKSTDMFNNCITWVSGNFGTNPQKISEWLNKTKGEIINTSSAAIGQTLVMIGNGVMITFLVPVYIFIILFYQKLLIEFIHKLFSKSNSNKVSEIVIQTKTLIQGYLKGLVIEGIIVGILDCAALLMLGIEYAILLGILGALLNVIPYIGGIIAVALPMMIALATKSSPWSAVYVLIAHYIVQLIDNNLIIPYVVASKVKINALFSIIVIIAGNALWGIHGMFLAIPLLAVIKLIFDNIEPLKPWGFLLGVTINPKENRKISTDKNFIQKFFAFIR